MFADYFTVAVRTGGAGNAGLSFLLLDKSMAGISCKQMDCSGVWASGTAFITFTDVRVPVSNLIGEENQGFKYVMYNFNHERWGFIVQANRFSRVCYEDSFRYAMKRKTFGKPLIDHPVIRWKLAEMSRQIETTHAMLEALTYQFNTMTKAEQNANLAGDCALIKAHATKVFEYCAREAAQIFGGNSYIRYVAIATPAGMADRHALTSSRRARFPHRGGQGEKVERLCREVRAYAVPGGSEEILLDLSVRQALKAAQKAKL
jgi:alkylation response protein AidB-like acyl-CoA dehydrogenase